MLTTGLNKGNTQFCKFHFTLSKFFLIGILYDDSNFRIDNYIGLSYLQRKS